MHGLNFIRPSCIRLSLIALLIILTPKKKKESYESYFRRVFKLIRNKNYFAKKKNENFVGASALEPRRVYKICTVNNSNSFPPNVFYLFKSFHSVHTHSLTRFTTINI